MPRRFSVAAKMTVRAILVITAFGFVPTTAESADAKAAFDKAMAEMAKTQAGSAAEATAMEKAIAAAGAVTPPPDTPDAVIDHVGRAKAAARLAKGPVDFLDAANAFGQAARLAPWVAEYHYNRGVLLEKAEKYEAAERAFGLYLKAAPNAKDRNAVRERIAGLRYAREKAVRERAAPPVASATSPPKSTAADLASYAGSWCHVQYCGKPEGAYDVSIRDNGIEIVNRYRFDSAPGKSMTFVKRFRGTTSNDGRVKGSIEDGAVLHFGPCAERTMSMPYAAAAEIKSGVIIVRYRSYFATTYDYDRCAKVASRMAGAPEWANMEITLRRR